MTKIIDFIKKWVFAISLIIVAIFLLFAMACCIYTAVSNVFVGITGSVGVALALTVVGGWIHKEINKGIDAPGE